MEKPNKIIVMTYTAYGDYITITGLLNILLMHYKIIYLWTDDKNHTNYCKYLFYNKQIELKSNTELFDLTSIDKNIHILIATHGYGKNMEFVRNVIKKNIFDFENLISNYISINDKYLIKHTELSDNENSIYGTIGLNKLLGMDLFNIDRNHNLEIIESNKLKKKYNINSKYDIVHSKNLNHSLLNNDYQHIYIENEVDCPISLLFLFESAEEIHVIENSNGLLIYHLNYKNYIDKNKKIYMHQYFRKGRNENLINVYKNPKLDNWNFIE